MHTPFRILPSALLSLIILAAVCASPAGARVSPSTGRAAAELVAPWVSDTAPGLAIAVMQDGKIVFHAEAGLADLAHAAPITEETVFHAASLSKQFTAFLVLSLAVEGELSLDDDIRLYLPELTAIASTVTIRHLLDHMGGLREQSSLRGMAGWSREDLVTPRQMLRLLSLQQGANFEPGAQVQYSNTGYGLLAEIVSRVSGKPFSAVAQERIFEPLGMSKTSFRNSLSRVIPNAAQSYAPGRNGFSHLALNYELLGSTGLQTTPSDLLKWAENFETQKIGDSRVFALMAERTSAANGEPAVHGRGQELRPYHGVQTWSHGGRDAGFRAFLLRAPDKHFAIAVLSNRADFDMAKFAFKMADVFLKASDANSAEPEETWTPATQAELHGYAGDYELFSGLIFSISTDGEQLFFAPLNSSHKSALPQIGEGRFMLNPADNISIEFVADASGRAIAFNYVVSLNGKLKAPRIALAPFDPSSVNLQSFEGVYESDELQIRYVFKVENGALTAQHLRLAPVRLTPYQEDTFSGSSSDFEKVVMERDASGAIVGCVVSGAMAENVRFRKVR